MHAASTRRSERRIVSMRPLKSWRSSWIDDANRESICASGSSTSCRRTRSIAKPSRLVDRARGAVDEADLALELTGQQLVGRHFVDLGQPQQARDRDGPLAPLVGAEDRRLELEGRARFDVVKRQALLTPDRPEALADACSRRRHLLSPLARLFATCDAQLMVRAARRGREFMTAPVRAAEPIVPARSVKVMLPRAFNMSHTSVSIAHTCHSRHISRARSSNNATAAIGAVSARRTCGPRLRRGTCSMRRELVGIEPALGPDDHDPFRIRTRNLSRRPEIFGSRQRSAARGRRRRGPRSTSAGRGRRSRRARRPARSRGAGPGATARRPHARSCAAVRPPARPARRPTARRTAGSGSA